MYIVIIMYGYFIVFMLDYLIIQQGGLFKKRPMESTIELIKPDRMHGDL